MSKMEGNGSEGRTRPKKFYVYGEDGLTLKYLRERLDIILEQLDKSKPEESEVYYRPSFGRGHYYGEFDAIILTPHHVYLIESKWDRSGDLSEGLRDEQTKRHDILMWYSKKWKGSTDDDWNQFREESEKEMNELFKEKEIPPTHSGRKRTTLSRNLRTVLADMGERPTINVLLIFYQDEKPNVVQEGFKVIFIKYKPTHGLFMELRGNGDSK